MNSQGKMFTGRVKLKSVGAPLEYEMCMGGVGAPLECEVYRGGGVGVTKRRVIPNDKP